jgi:hypothetical protein
MTDTDAMIDELAATADRLRELTRGAAGSTLDAQAPGEWSARTVLAHLRDDEFLVMRLRLERILVEDQPSLAPFDEQAWEAHRWRGRDGLVELLDDFDLQRAASIAILRRVEGDIWQRSGLQPEYGTLTVRTWLDHWLGHDKMHLAQIARSLSV